MGREPGSHGGADDELGADLPGRDPRLSGFAGGEWDGCPPSAALAARRQQLRQARTARTYTQGPKHYPT